jgi:hypothetical protein
MLAASYTAAAIATPRPLAHQSVRPRPHQHLTYQQRPQPAPGALPQTPPQDRRIDRRTRQPSSEGRSRPGPPPCRFLDSVPTAAHLRHESQSPAWIAPGAAVPSRDWRDSCTVHARRPAPQPRQESASPDATLHPYTQVPHTRRPTAAISGCCRQTAAARRHYRCRRRSTGVRAWPPNHPIIDYGCAPGGATISVPIRSRCSAITPYCHIE